MTRLLIMAAVMHLIVSFAAPLSPAGLAALPSLKLPALGALLAQWQPQADLPEGDEFTLNTPHERALARALGWPVAPDGALPLAAHLAAADGVALDPRPVGLLSPVHQRVGTEQVSLFDPLDLALDDSSARTLFDIVRPWFESEGFALHWGAPLRWYLQHDLLGDVGTASLDRVASRNLNAWLPLQRDAPLLRRLNSELQMLLYTHPFNDAREAAGALPVNALWLSGTGARPGPAKQPTTVVLDDRLRSPALHEDWPAWSQAWQALDTQVLAPLLREAGPGHRLTLAGERRALTLVPARAGLLSRLAARWRARSPAQLLETL